MVAWGCRSESGPFGLESVWKSLELAWDYSLDQLRGQPQGSYSDPWNDCGPASLAAVRAWRDGIHIEPDQIRDDIYGDGYRGYTYTEDLAAYARTAWGYQATDRTETGDRIKQIVMDTLRAGKNIITLTKEPEGYYHFTPVTGFNEDVVIRHNVLGGRREVLSWYEFLQRFAGWIILLSN